MKYFYSHYFNAKPENKYHNPSKEFTSYFLSFNEGCRLELMHKPTIPKNENNLQEEYIGIIHFAISVGSKEVVDELTDQLRT